MKGRDIIAKIIAEDGLNKDYAFENKKSQILNMKNNVQLQDQKENTCVNSHQLEIFLVGQSWD